MQVFATELMRLAHHVAGRPEAGALAAALRAALVIVSPSDRTLLSMSLARDLEDIAGALIMLGDRAEWLVERLTDVTPRPD